MLIQSVTLHLAASQGSAWKRCEHESNLEIYVSGTKFFSYLAKYWAGFCASAEVCLCASVVLVMANWPDSYVFLFASGIPARAG